MPLLTPEEVDCLKIGRGTLSDKEREIINSHASISAKMLASLPYPKDLKRVPQFAGAHHEKLNGHGYPLGLKGDEIPMQARIIALADVFEALTASDRPYKKAMPLSRALKILGQMTLEGHIDEDLFNLFISKKIYLTYAKKFLAKESIDPINLNEIPGFKE